MKYKITLISTILVLSLFIGWMVHEPGFEPLIGIFASLTVLTIEILLPKYRRNAANFVYVIQVRGIEIDTLMKNIMNEYFEIKGYHKEVVGGEWVNISIHSKTKLQHDKMYKFAGTICSQMGGKIYFVEGEGKKFGLLEDAGPAQYLTSV